MLVIISILKNRINDNLIEKFNISKIDKILFNSIRNKSSHKIIKMISYIKYNIELHVTLCSFDLLKYLTNKISSYVSYLNLINKFYY